MCERAGEVKAQTRSKSLQLKAIFRAYTKVRRYILYLSKQLYNPQHNLCCRHGGLILPGRHLCHVDWYVPLSQAHDDVNLQQLSSISKPPLPPPFPMDWIHIPSSGSSSSGGGAILLIVLVLQAAAHLPLTLPSMVGCCVPTPLSTAPTPAAFVRRHAIVAVLVPIFVQSGQR